MNKKTGNNGARGSRGPGRPKGSPNKLTRTIKEAIELAFDELGGAKYLKKMANEQPAAFMNLLGKVLPTQVEANITTSPAYTVDDWVIPADAQQVGHA